MRKLAALLAVTVLAGALVACGEDGSDDATTRGTNPIPPTTAPLPPGNSLVAHAKGPSITPVEAPGSDAAIETLPNPRPVGAGDAEVELVFLVKDEGPDDWLEVYLPIRPNGITGWISRDEVDLVRVPYRIEVSLATFQLELYENDELVLETPVGLGREDEPTPPGQYFITELLQPPDPDGVYGPFAYGLSGFSEVHYEFGGGPGQLGLHGTNQPELIGGNASAGCIRLPNEVILELVEQLPLGTPVEILA